MSCRPPMYHAEALRGLSGELFDGVRETSH